MSAILQVLLICAPKMVDLVKAIVEARKQHPGVTPELLAAFIAEVSEKADNTDTATLDMIAKWEAAHPVVK
jgi:hypothetical protein